MIEIHVSDVRQFVDCRRKWKYSSPLKMNLEPVEPQPHFYLGRAVHAALQAYYDFGEDPELTFEAEALKEGNLPDMIELGKGMMRHYRLWQKARADQPFSDANLRFVSLETRFTVPLPGFDDARYAGRFDGVVQTEDDAYWLFETKTTRSISELEASLPMDEQGSLYVWAAEKLLGIEISGVIYNLLRKKVPNVTILSDGSVSRDKRQDTSYEWTKQVIIDLGLDPAAYDDYLKYLWYEKETAFFKRVEIRKPRRLLSLAVGDFIAKVKEMLNSDTPLYPAPNFIKCNFCKFRQPCMAESVGAQPTFAEYRQRQELTEEDSI